MGVHSHTYWVLSNYSNRVQLCQKCSCVTVSHILGHSPGHRPGHSSGHSLVTTWSQSWSQSGHSLVIRSTGTLHHQRSLAVHVSDVVVVDVGDGGRRHVAQLCAQSAEGGPLVRLLGPALRHRFVEPGMNIVKLRH